MCIIGRCYPASQDFSEYVQWKDVEKSTAEVQEFKQEWGLANCAMEDDREG